VRMACDTTTERSVAKVVMSSFFDAPPVHSQSPDEDPGVRPYAVRCQQSATMVSEAVRVATTSHRSTRLMR
jgi:hypothetical protein